ncbi:MAG TPA: ABC transporter ATP-binding protein [Planctomycetota bacterium]|nr:ABC transporter ATP-binding protein [Planctomycetota bacterium]
MEDQDAPGEAVAPRPWIRRTLRYFAPFKLDVALAAVLLAASSGLALVGPLILQHAIDVDVKAKKPEALARTALVYVGVLVTLVLVTLLQRAQLNRVGFSAMAALRKDLLRRIALLPVSVFDEQPAGKLMTRVMSDVDALRELMTGTFLAMIGDVILFVAMASIMLAVDWKLALIALGLLPFIATGFVIFQRKAGPRFAFSRARNATLVGFLAEHLRAMPVLQALDRTEWARERCRELGQARYDADRANERVVITYFNSITLTEAIGTAAILLVGGARCAAGTLTVGTLVLFFEYVRRYYEPVHRLSDQLSILERARAAASRIYALLDKEPEPEVLLPAAPRDGSPGEIRFDDVWFAYKGEEWVLKGVSFVVPPGARYALVGPTGHGKSTILSLLLRFHAAQRGRVLVDGEDVRTVPLPKLRARFGLVMQDVRLFPGTLAENVLLDSADHERARRALEQVSAQDLIARLPDGLDTVLGDGGEGLSFGERQLVACARALARQPEILLLDEATSSVDPATEARLHDALEELLRGRTSLTIAHRLATVRSADRILLLEKGEVAEQGTRRELLALGGKYAALERLQSFEDAGDSSPPRSGGEAGWGGEPVLVGAPHSISDAPLPAPPPAARGEGVEAPTHG